MQKPLYPVAPVAQLHLVVMQDHEVVHIPGVVAGAQLVLGEPVELIEIDIGEQLASEVAERDANARGARARINDAIQQGERVMALDVLAQQPLEHGMINAGEISADVGLEAVQLSVIALHYPHPVLHPVCTGVGALAVAASVRVEDKAPVDNRFEHIYDGAVNHSVRKSRGGDQPLLWLKNIKLLVAARRIAAVEQVEVGMMQVLLQALHVAQRCRRVALSA